MTALNCDRVEATAIEAVREAQPLKCKATGPLGSSLDSGIASNTQEVPGRSDGGNEGTLKFGDPRLDALLNCDESICLIALSIWGSHICLPNSLVSFFPVGSR